LTKLKALDSSIITALSMEMEKLWIAQGKYDLAIAECCFMHAKISRNIGKLVSSSYFLRSFWNDPQRVENFIPFVVKSLAGP
jgi:hypothetical protein